MVDVVSQNVIPIIKNFGGAIPFAFIENGISDSFENVNRKAYSKLTILLLLKSGLYKLFLGIQF